MKDNIRYVQFIEFCLLKRDPSYGGVEGFQDDFSFTLQELAERAKLSLTEEEMIVMLNRMKTTKVYVRASGSDAKEPVLEDYSISDGTFTMVDCTTEKLDAFGKKFEDYQKIKGQRSGDKQLIPFSSPPGSDWSDLVIKIRGDANIFVAYNDDGDQTVQKLNYQKTGFSNEQTSDLSPNGSWKLLLKLASNSSSGVGLIRRPPGMREMDILKNSIAKLNKILKKLFPSLRLPDKKNPVFFDKSVGTYKTSFKLYPSSEIVERENPRVFESARGSRTFDNSGDGSYGDLDLSYAEMINR